MWFRKAADQEHAKAQYILGRMHEYGDGVPQDDAEALLLYHDAADGGCSDAQLRLFWLYQEQNPQVAAAWCRKAADQGNARAQFWLAILHSSGGVLPKNASQATAWIRRAAGNGDENAQFLLGVMYRSGKDVPQDYTRAAAWLRKAADQGHLAAQSELGKMYVAGTGIPKDLVHAYMWFSIAIMSACESSRKSALELRQTIDRERQAIECDMTPSEVVEATRRARACMKSDYQDRE